MSKSTTARLFLAIVLIAAHGSLLVCEEERCWNSSFSLPFYHPAHQVLSWAMRQLPLQLSTVQRIAQGLLVAEGVIVINFCMQALCRCILLVFQCVIVTIALCLCYQISQQDMQTTFMKLKTSIDGYLYWNAIASSL
jgi:hypothetical protein